VKRHHTPDATTLFERWRSGDEGALEELLPQVYDELRRLARTYLSQERRGHTLQPTSVVNEALVRLLGSDVRPNDRRHFFALAASTMRRVLVDHARKYQAERRFSPSDRVTLDGGELRPSNDPVDVLDLHRGLKSLAQVSERAAKVMQLMYFGGLTRAEVAEVLGIGSSTVDRDWSAARLWLRRSLSR
jgi:RNA polymerase sigma factor (TIGR02999 family)